MITNNDILRRLRYTFGYTDERMLEIFALNGTRIPPELLAGWLKKEDDINYTDISDFELATFLNGLIIEKRGPREDAQMLAEEFLTNNMVLRKLKIALNLQAEDMLAILQTAGRTISKHELSAFFRNPDQAQYRRCNDQILRNFLKGLQMRYRPGSKTQSDDES